MQIMIICMIVYLMTLPLEHKLHIEGPEATLSTNESQYLGQCLAYIVSCTMTIYWMNKGTKGLQETTLTSPRLSDKI